MTRQLRSSILAAAFAAVISTPAVAAPATTSTSPAGHVLHFPAERSLGMLYMTWESTKGFDPTLAKVRREYLGEATGDVIVPAGKRLCLMLNESSGNNLAALAALGPNDLHELWLAKTAGDAGIRHLTHLTGLKELGFAWAAVQQGKVPVFSERALKQLAGLKSLETLKAPAGMTDAALTAIVEALPQLKDLTLDHNRVTDAGLAKLPKLKRLERVVITSGALTNAGLAHLAEMPSLQDVWLEAGSSSGARLTDVALRHIRKIPALKRLKLVGGFSDAGLAHLTGHPAIEDLDVHYINVTDRGLAHLTSLPALKKLNLNLMSGDSRNPPITDAGVALLKKIKTLEDLSLPGIGVTDAGLAHVGEMKGLKRLWAGGWGLSPLSDAGVQHLTRLPSLEALSIGGTGITAEGLSSIARMTNLRMLFLLHAHREFDGAALAKLASLKSLESLYVQAIEKVPVSAVNQLNALSNLTRLQMSGLMVDGATLKLDGLARLEYLKLESAKGSALRDEDLACLANLKQLGFLQVGRSDAITDAGVAYLAGLAELSNLSAGGRGVTDRGLASLSGLKKLNGLHITGSFTDAGLCEIEDLKGLTNLWIHSGRGISLAAQGRLRRSLPNLFRLTVDRDKSLVDGSGSVSAATQPASAHPKPGAPAPDFTVTTLDGNKFTLSEQRGKVVLLHFWATWCRPCIAAIPSLKKAEESRQKRYGQRLQILHLALDDLDTKVRGLVEDHQWSGIHACIGMNSELAADYGVEDAPDEFLIGPDGRILLNKESPEGPGDTEAVIDKALKGL